ncbi:NRDE family protein [Vibrio marisflavi]|uniref:Transport and Golgi organization protein 2 n=1 Tax=Vibrio marisflavi CECT 7928 TaxID=634439 RepID=A0ABM9A520_9VIBR|nr:NRDE family protein [Vibrio marisflavi]CAH0539921.1 hypothetical protein VMF7928_02525 [Vibrio marisflavi CECT 7928]
MCSVSWLTTEDGYQVLFNRDEQRSRAVALPPQQLDVEGTSVLMPIDPVGMGSWISMNEHGLSLCILNNYQGLVPNGTLISRGQLLKDLSVFNSVSDVSTAFKKVDLNSYTPFTLLAFDPKLTRNNMDVIAFAWDGQTSSIFPTDSPLFSSKVDPVNVQVYRQRIYQELTAKEKSISTLIQFHTHHHPEFPHMSTCMSREDAKTVSFTYLTVTSARKSMAYVPGSPCQNLTQESLTNNSYQISPSEIFVS